MKLSQLRKNVEMQEEGVPVTLYDPLGQPYTASDGSEVTVTVIGMQTKARREAEKAEQTAAAKAANIDDAFVLQSRARKAAACVTDWHGVETEDGQPIEFSKDNVVAMLAIDQRVLFQVEQAIERHALFLARSRTS